MKKIFTLTIALVIAICLWASDFESGDLFYKITSSNTVELESADEEISSATIPSAVSHNGTTYSVTSIAEYAFKACRNLKSVVIPNTVKTVGGGVFYNCTALQSVVLSNQMTSLPSVKSRVEYGFFQNCESLLSVVIPHSISSIGANAFCGCRLMHSVTIGSGVTSIGKKAFIYCTFAKDRFINNSSLEEKTNSYWGARIVDEEIDGMLIVKDTIIECRNYNSSITVPNSVKGIADRAFSKCSTLQSISFGTGITHIASYAFDGCTALNSIHWNAKKAESMRRYILDDYNLVTPFNYFGSQITSFTFGNDVEIIPDYLCYGMNELKSVAIPKNIKRIGHFAFSLCSSLGSISLPDDVRSIGNSAFSSCNALGSITIPSSVDSIGYSAFSFCTSLSSVVIPKGVLYIDDNPFRSCNALKSIQVEAGNPNYDSRNNCNAVIDKNGLILVSGCINTVIPNGIKKIGNTAFAGILFSTITIPDGVKEIGVNAFSDCSALTSITIPYGVDTIREGGFYSCSSLEAIKFPSTVKFIGNLTLYGCDALKSIQVEAGNPNYDSRNNCNALIHTASNTLLEGCDNTVIPNGIKVIDEWAFYRKHNLKSITIPNSVEQINSHAFYACTSLMSITIPHSVKTIGEYAFANCYAIEEVSIGRGVESNLPYMFYYCDSIKTIYMHPITPPGQLYINFVTFNVKQNAILYVPCESVEAYKANQVFSGFINMECFNPEETAVEDVIANPSANAMQKVLRDGQLMIIYEGKEYNTLGQCL